MPNSMGWLATMIRLAIGPVIAGAIATLMSSPGTSSEVAAAVGLLVLAAVHCAYWWDPWRRTQLQAVLAATIMIALNFTLLNVVGLAEPLVWLYPALVAGAGLRTRIAVAGIALTGLAAAAPLAVESGLVHPSDALHAAQTLGPSHSVLLSIVLAGLGMHAVRQLIAANIDLHATRAELAEMAVAADRQRLAHELHDLLARTLSLIAVKAELASRLSTRGDQAAAAELADVQALAREAVREVRDAVTGEHSPSLEAELAAAEKALRTAGIQLQLERNSGQVDPRMEPTLAWALREAVTNVVKHSGATTCWIALNASCESASLEVEDDGRGPTPDCFGTGLAGLADRLAALGGELQVGSSDGAGFRVRVRIGAASTLTNSTASS